MFSKESRKGPIWWWDWTQMVTGAMKEVGKLTEFLDLILSWSFFGQETYKNEIDSVSVKLHMELYGFRMAILIV